MGGNAYRFDGLPRRGYPSSGCNALNGVAVTDDLFTAFAYKKTPERLSIRRFLFIAGQRVIATLLASG